MDERRKPSPREIRPPGPRGGHGMPMAMERPKEAHKILRRLLTYLRYKKLTLIVVFVLMLISTFSMLAGSYFLKPLINNYIIPGDFKGLAGALLVLAGIYLVGTAAAYLQSRLMIQVAQKTTNTMRRDLFVKMQSLPLQYFDTNTHGDLMSRYTNDLDNVQMALEQSLVQLVSSTLNFAGAVILMLVLSPVLFLITFLVLVAMFFVSTKLAKRSGKNF
jgi:ATP-binding cassette subfamily B protein